MAKENITRKISIFINGNEVKYNLKEVGKEIGTLRGQLRNLVPGTQEFVDKSKELKHARKAYAEINDEIRGTNGLLDKIKKQLGPVASGFLAAFSIGAVVTAAGSALRNAAKTINEFEQSVADLKAITGATGDDLEYLKKQAISLGAETKGGATAVVEAYKLIASAKPELLENVEALNQVTKATLTLAKASGMEMPAAATALTDAMNQFKAPASEASKFIDALANGAKYGAAEIPHITEGILKFGSVARSSNIDIKESVALIELLAENGDKGAEAGTKLRNILLKISAPDALPKEAVEVISGLGISMEFLKDKTIPIQQKLEALKPLLQDNANVVKVFGIENSVAAINVLSQTERLAELTSKMGEYGTANEQAAIKMDTVNNKTEILKSTYDSLILNISNGGGAVSNFFKFMIDGATNALISLGRLNTSWDELFDKAKLEGAAKGATSFQSQFNALIGKGSDAEVAKSIKTEAQKNFKLLLEAQKENNEKLREHNPWAINFGEGSRTMKLRKEELTKQINEQLAIIKEANAKITPIKSTGGTDPVIPPIDPETPTDKTKNEAAAKKKVFEKAEEELKELIKKQQEERAISQKIGLEKELAQIDEKYRVQIEKAVGHDDRIKELEANREQEKADLKLLREAETAQRIKDFEEQNRLEEEALKLEKEAINAATDEERVNLLLERTRWIANEQLRIEEEKELKKLRLAGATEEEIASIQKKFTLEKGKVELAFTNGKKEADKQAVENEKTLNRQRTQEYSNMFGNIAALVGKNTIAGKAAAIAQATMNTYQGVTEVWSAKSVLPEPFATAAKVVSTGTVLASGFAAVKNITGTKTPKGFKTGGYSGSGGVDDIAGVVHKEEYIIPKFIMQDPSYAPMINALESKRTETLNETNSLPPSVAGANVSNELVVQAFYALMAKLDQPLIANALIGDAEIKRQELRNKKLIQNRENAKIK
jgi:TP901 family phage tail tape measure protein